MSEFNATRTNTSGDYVPYWCQMFRRLRANHALDHAVGYARSLKKSLGDLRGTEAELPVSVGALS